MAFPRDRYFHSMSVFPQSRPRAVESVSQICSIYLPVFPSPSRWKEANAGLCTDHVTLWFQDMARANIRPGLQNQFRHSFKMTKSYFALTVTRIYSLCPALCNTWCHGLSLAFFDVVLPKVSEFCRLCKLTNPSTQNSSSQRKPPRTETQNRFQSWRRSVNKTCPV